jgi:hypothetical protein
VTHATQLIVSASGGHPYLVGAATNRMFRVLLGRERTGSSIAYEAGLNEELDQYLLDNISPITFRAMDWAEQQLPLDVFGELLELANHERLEPAPLVATLSSIKRD